MKTNLTLSIEKSVLVKAKRYAKASGKSISDIIESYLERITSSLEESEIDVPEEFKDLFGCVNLRENIDEKAEIRNRLNNKHHSRKDIS